MATTPMAVMALPILPMATTPMVAIKDLIMASSPSGS
jgi:hypothetical protein